MGKIGAVAQANNAVDANLTLDDMSGWVNVEMPEEESNRIGSKGAERLEEIASQQQGGDANAPVSDSATLVERLYATAMRKADGADSSESLRRALGVSVDGKIEEAYADLDKCRMAACNAMNDLDSLTGREIASAEDGEAQPDAKALLARALLNDAVTAQRNYADKLGDLADTLPETEAAQKTALLQLKDRALRRANAITNLHKQLKDAAGKATAANSEYDKTLLDRRGHTDSIYLKEAKQQGKDLKALLANNNVLSADVLGTEALSTAFSDLYGAYGEGVKKDDEMLQKVKRCEVLGAAAHNIIDRIELPRPLTDAFKACEKVQNDEQVNLLMALFPDNQGHGNGTPADFGKKLRGAFVAFKTSLSRYVDVKLGDERPDERKIAAATKDLDAKIKELNSQFKEVKTQVSVFSKNAKLHLKFNVLKPETIAAVGKVGDCEDVESDWDLHIEDVERLCSIPNGDEKAIELSEDDCLALMEGTRRLSTAVEAQIWKEGGHHDEELKGAVLLDSKTIGHGTFNVVKLCTFAKPDGTTVQRVFRPDRGARRSILKGGIAEYLSDPGDVSGFSYSRASEKVASVFGCEDVFPKTTFGTLNGEPGMFLEVAPGKTGQDIKGCRQADLLKENDPLDGRGGVDTAGAIARKLNRLQWLDCLTGQVDRHMGNVMIGTAGNDVSVKGIDNDECFPDMYLGDGLLVFDSQADAFRLLGEGNHKLSEVLSLSADLSSSPRLRSYINGKPELEGKIVLDMAKLPLNARLERMKKFMNFGLPDHIDKDLYKKLRSMTPKAYEESLKGQNLTKRQILAAVARFCHIRDVIDQSSKVEVYNAEDWKKVDKLQKASKKSKQLNAEFDELARKAQTDYQRKNAEFQHVKKQYPKGGKEFDEALAKFEQIGDQYAKNTQAIEGDRQTISNIMSNYYARVGCHQYLGLPLPN